MHVNVKVQARTGSEGGEYIIAIGDRPAGFDPVFAVFICANAGLKGFELDRFSVHLANPAGEELMHVEPEVRRDGRFASMGFSVNRELLGEVTVIVPYGEVGNSASGKAARFVELLRNLDEVQSAGLPYRDYPQVPPFPTCGEYAEFLDDH